MTEIEPCQGQAHESRFWNVTCRDFTLDPVQYAQPKMDSFLERLHSRRQRWVPIVDPGIKIDPGYPAYDTGMAGDVFVNDQDGSPFVGQVRVLSYDTGPAIQSNRVCLLALIE